MIVGLHGYGGTGGEFQSCLSGVVPSRVCAPHWYTPDGPLPATLARRGFAWHGLTRRLDSIASHLEDCLPALCDQVRARHRQAGLSPAVTAAVGFSQGGVLAAGLLAAGVCSAAAAVCAPLLGEERSGLVPWRGVRLIYIAGGNDRTIPQDRLRADHPLFTSGAAQLLVLSTMGHEFRADAATNALEFVVFAIEREILRTSI